METQSLSTVEFGKFRDFIYEACGMRVDEKKITMLSHRIRSRLKAGDFDSFRDYYKHLTSKAGQAEIEFFLDAVTTNETFFFRTESHFDWFKKKFISEMIASHRAGNRPKQFRIWSAACSTGEEVYSLSICLAENHLRLKDWNVEVIGTDISEAALSQARIGTYRQRTIEPLGETRLRRWMQAGSDGLCWTVRDDLRSRVNFLHHNLMDSFDQTPFDCIFIRNVLIYFDQDSKRKVIANLIDALAPGGYLVVGPSEGIYNMLEPLEKQESFLYQKPPLQT